MVQKTLYRTVLRDAGFYSTKMRLPDEDDDPTDVFLEAVAEIQRITGYVDIDVIKRWVKTGDVDRPDGKGLSSNNLKKLLTAWAGVCPMFQTREDVRYFLERGRQKYKDWLWSPEFREWCQENKLPPGRLSPYWEQFELPLSNRAGRMNLPPLPVPFLPRQGLVEQLLKKEIALGIRERRLALIYGPPGAGKTVLLNCLARKLKDRKDFEQLAWVPGDRNSSADDWLENIGLSLSHRSEWFIDAPRARKVVLLRRLISGKKVCLFLDDCWAPELVFLLEQILEPGDLAVLTARTESNVHLEMDQRVCKEVFPIRETDALRYYFQNTGTLLDEETREQWLALGQAVEFNMLALRLLIALHREMGVPLEHLLREVETLPPVNGHINLAVRLAVVHLPDDALRCLGYLSELPVLRSYDEMVWDALWGEQRESAEPLFRTGLIEMAGNDAWQIHAEVRRLAERYADELSPAERENAREWLTRMIFAPAFEEIYQKYMQDLTVPSLVNVIRAERNPESDLLPHYPVLLKRVLLRLSGRLFTASERPIFERISPQLSARHYALANRVLDEKQRRVNRLVVLVFLLLVPACLVKLIMRSAFPDDVFWALIVVGEIWAIVPTLVMLSRYRRLQAAVLDLWHRRNGENGVE